MARKQILFPTDFSESADDALEYAIALARGMGASLSIVHVKPEPMLPAPYDDEQDPSEARIRAMLEEVRPAGSSVPYEHHFLHAKGNPGDALVRFAQKHHIDLIVMAAHGQTGTKDKLMGAVAEVVVGHAPCPVLTVNRSRNHRAAKPACSSFVSV